MHPATGNFLLVDDHPLFAQGFSSAVNLEFPSATLALAETGEHAKALIKRHHYDMVFIDFRLGDMSGLDLLAEIPSIRFGQPATIITGSVSYWLIERARALGALGVLSKRADANELREQCLRLLAGEPVYCPDSMPNQQTEPDAPTARELEVLGYLCEGLGNARICDVLSISDSTLRTHLRSIFQKLDATSRTDCIVQATKRGWV